MNNLQHYLTVSIMIAGCTGMNEMPHTNQLIAATESSEVMSSDVLPVALTSSEKQTTKPSHKGHITLAWNPVAGAKWYNLYYGTKPGVRKNSHRKVTKITDTSYTVTGLSLDTTYFFVVTAANSKTESPISGEVSGKPRK